MGFVDDTRRELSRVHDEERERVQKEFEARMRGVRLLDIAATCVKQVEKAFGVDGGDVVLDTRFDNMGTQVVLRFTLHTKGILYFTISPDQTAKLSYHHDEVDCDHQLTYTERVGTNFFRNFIELFKGLLEEIERVRLSRLAPSWDDSSSLVVVQLPDCLLVKCRTPELDSEVYWKVIPDDIDIDGHCLCYIRHNGSKWLEYLGLEEHDTGYESQMSRRFNVHGEPPILPLDFNN